MQSQEPESSISLLPTPTKELVEGVTAPIAHNEKYDSVISFMQQKVQERALSAQD